MIILDEDEQQLPKLANPAPVYASSPVNRHSTSTYSLPDYETSEAQHKTLDIIRKARYYRCRRIALIFLFVYCILTVIIGVPLIVLRIRHERIEELQSSVWNPQQASVVPTFSGQNLASNPPPFQSAIECDNWSATDLQVPGSLHSTLNYTLAFDPNGIYLGSNASYKVDGTDANSVCGSLLVDINPDPTVTQAVISVDMSYSNPYLREKTHVCLVKISGDGDDDADDDVDLVSSESSEDGNGLYIYAPAGLNQTERLVFNLTLWFPQPSPHGPPLNVSNFAAMLPLFQQYYGDLNGKVRFGDAVLGGPMSTVNVESISADNLVVMSSPGEIQGNFEASYELILETMSAAIQANVTMRSDGSDSNQPSLRINTGNSPLNATINLVRTVAKSSKALSGSSPMPTFYIDANTFNAPLTLSVIQEPLPSSSAMPVFIHATNNLDETRVTLDSNFEGTFFAQTEYASVSVVDGPINSRNYTQFPQVPSIADVFGRTLWFDNPTDSQVAGWIGRGQKSPVFTSSSSSTGAPGCVQVLSVLSPITIDLGS